MSGVRRPLRMMQPLCWGQGASKSCKLRNYYLPSPWWRARWHCVAIFPSTALPWALLKCKCAHAMHDTIHIRLADLRGKGHLWVLGVAVVPVD